MTAQLTSENRTAATSTPAHAPAARYTWLDLVIVLAVGFGLANAPVADTLARGAEALGASALGAMSLAWLMINGTQLAVGLAVTRHRFGSVRGPLRLHRPRFGQLGAAAGWGVAKAALTVGLLIALPAALTADGGGEGGYPPGSVLAQLTFAVVFGAVTAPIYEEVLYRGVFFQGLAARMPVLPAILTSAVFFSVMHLPRVFNAIVALASGLLFAWLLHRYRNLWVPIVAHALSNGLLLALAFAVKAG
ncbi:CPBP family intramembrane metalloprotease [Micromonospora sp. R77]|uniref:CPBP family intramembrane glutamic endopeptidase n=1 Tax=Micromonospora sp. R77 TaxID=2925836 RepID=UPI001F616264|nr:CPBP family intramembrane glutamic endopeptidase [Micromonospora sp. R77]MCI4062823.1 CPBP family intramembrane metalloprotease [Micromonospora sp. R77]